MTIRRNFVPTPGQRRARATLQRMAHIRAEIAGVLGKPFAEIVAKNGSSVYVLQAIYEAVLHKGPINVVGVKELVPHVSKSTVERDLKRLEEMGLLEKISTNYLATEHGPEFDNGFIEMIDAIRHLIGDFDTTTNLYVAEYRNSTNGDGNGNGKRRR